MHQDNFFYPMQPYPQGNASLQCQNVNSCVQPDGTVWPVIPQAIPQNPNMYNNLLPNMVTPVLTATYGTTSTFSWAHTVPSLMPWVSKCDPNVPEPVVRFTAPFPPDPCTSQTATSWELFNNLGANKTNANIHLKRKSDIETFESAPQKLCITEERMAARMKELHISNTYSVPSENTPLGPSAHQPPCNTEKSVTNLKQLEVMLKDFGSEATKSLILAPELKKLVEPDKIFASTFLSKVERPSMAVVVWQPQQNAILSKDNKEEEKSNFSHPTPEANNNTVTQQLLMTNPFTSHLQPTQNNLTLDDIMDT